MDNSISTVKNGKLISFRKGIEVSKQSHQGTSFVNASAEDTVLVHRSNRKYLSSRRFNVRFTASREHVGTVRRSETLENERPVREPAIKPVVKKKTTKAQKQPRKISTATTKLQTTPGLAKQRSDSNLLHSSPQSKIPRSIADWTAHQTPVELTRAHKRALQFYFDLIPRRTYPFELYGALTHNPLRRPEAYQNIFTEPLVLECVLSTGAICGALQCHTRDWTVLALHSAKLCSLINVILNDSISPSRLVAVLQSVATLALLAHLSSRYDQWHVHMNGLTQLTQSAGYRVLTRSSVRWLIHKADINGSTELAIDCYLPLTRYYPSIYKIFDEDRAETREIINRCASVFCSSEALMQTLTEFVLFLKALNLARSRSDVRFDPDPLMEAYHSLGYGFLTIPSCKLFDDNPTVPESIPNDMASSMGLGYTCLKAVESSVRLSCLLYAKRGNPDPIDMRSKNPVLLGLLEKNLRLVLAGIRKTAEDNLIDPRLLLNQNSSGAVSSRKTLTKRLRPALIYVILIGDFTSHLNHRKADETRYGISVYHEVLVEVVGETVADVDAVPETDLDLCRLCDLPRLTGKEFHMRDTMRRMIEEYLDKRAQIPGYKGLGFPT